MSALARFCNAGWLSLCLPEAQRFRSASADVRGVQSTLLRRLLSRNGQTWFGRQHQFGQIQGAVEYRRAVPLSTYDDYREPIERIARGDQGVLTAERVLLLEPTSGTTSAEKLVPYTAGLRRQFQRAVRVWIADLFRHRPAVRRGAAYWSVTPLASEDRTTAGGIRVGFYDDSQYLAAVEQILLYGSLAVPPDVARCESVASALYATSFFLLRAGNLALISVWSPTFLSELLSFLRRHAGALCRDVAAGEISRPMHAALQRSYRPMPRRAARVASVLETAATRPDWAQRLWPELALVSCWCDGPSSLFASALREQLPAIEFQPKGLLATEAAISVPLVGRPGAALAVRSHFFEFRPVHHGCEPVGQDTLLADELTVGERYQVVVTTAGGFYRYQLRDEIEVVGFYREVPLIRFIGKCDHTSDMVGEKLSASQVQFALDSALATLQINAEFAELIAEMTPRPSYFLRISSPGLSGGHASQRQLEERLDDALKSNPGYAYARQLGQLGPLRVRLLESQEASMLAAQRVRAQCDSLQRHGNLKPRILIGPEVFHQRLPRSDDGSRSST